LEIFNYAIEKLGYERTKNCHIHFSKIEFGEKGEIRHKNYEDEGYGPEFPPLASAIKALGLSPTIICESHEFMAEDALVLKNIYENT
jgi:deoxyribonuclease-4